jgi:adenylate cyclase
LQTLDAALRRDPFPPLWAWEVRGSALYGLHRYEEALESYHKVDIDYYWMPAFLAACYAQLGRAEEAQRAIADYLKCIPDATVTGFRRRFHSGSVQWREHLAEGLRLAGLPD